MIIKKIGNLLRGTAQEENASAENLSETWEEYLSTNPSSHDLSLLFIRYGKSSIHESEEIKELAWQEMKSRTDLDNIDLLHVILNCGESAWIAKEAWHIVSKEDLEQRYLDSIVRSLGSSHPISQEIEEKFGKSKESALEKIDALVR